MPWLFLLALVLALARGRRQGGGDAPHANEPGLNHKQSAMLAQWYSADATRSRAPNASQVECTLSDLTNALALGSAELAAYLRAVYGAERDAVVAAARERWFVGRLGAFVNVVWLHALPAALRARCWWPANPSGLGSPYLFHSLKNSPHGLLWIYRLPYRVPCGSEEAPRVSRRRALHADAERNSSDASRLLASAVSGGAFRCAERAERVMDEKVSRTLATCALAPGRDGWLEVTHVHDAARNGPNVRDMWFYLAHGSGLWLRVRDLLFVGGVLTRWGKDVSFLNALATGVRAGTISPEGGVAIRHKCELWGPVPRVELALWRTSAHPDFMVELCAAGRFAAGWSPGVTGDRQRRSEKCRCAWKATQGQGAMGSLSCQ